MKKLVVLFLGLFLSAVAANAAENVKVISLENFTTAEPPATIDVKVLSNVELGKYSLNENNIIHCEIVSVIPAARGKRNASFIVKATSIVANGETIPVDGNLVASYSKRVLSKEELKNVDKGKLMLNATKAVGGMFVKGFGQGISFAQGVVENDGQKPIRSGIKQVYKDSPLSYVEKGEELNVNVGDEFYLVFKELD